jgi:hypothetical protein
MGILSTGILHDKKNEPCDKDLAIGSLISVIRGSYGSRFCKE